MIAVSGAPGTGYGSILLIDGVRYQDLLLTCSATMTKGAVVGLVFGYVDNQNYWVKLYSLEDGKWYLYRVSGGRWVQRDWESASISDGTPFTMQAEVRAGAVDDYSEALPAGQVGLWSSSASDHSFDDFKVRDIAGPFEVDGRWFCDKGNVHVDAGDSNLLEASGTDGVEDCIVRRGFRGDKYVATFRFKWNGSTSPGWVIRWLSPGDYLAVAVSAADQKARLYQRTADGHLATLAVSAGSVSLSSGTWYEGKVVVDDDPNDAELQQLRFWADGTLLLTTTAVDDEWSAGQVGLYRAPGGSAIQQYDDVKIGYDSNGDGDISDAGDVLQVADDFASSVLTCSYDANGNLAGDGVYRYAYDAWNRLRKVQRVAGHGGQADDVTTIAEYVYVADNRRASKVVSHCGPQAAPGYEDGGDTTVHFYYSNKWQILETRNGSNRSTRQWVWGTRYVDELVFMDVNGSPSFSNNCDPDVGDAGQGEDRRYFYHQDRNWNVVALTEYDDGVGTDARVVERYAYTPYGEFIVLSGDSGSGELGGVRPMSSVGNPFLHQGLCFDQEKGSYQNRRREYPPQRFAQRDPAANLRAGDRYLYHGARPADFVDPLGLWYWVSGNALCHCLAHDDCDSDCRSGQLGGTYCPQYDFLGIYGNCACICDENINRLVHDAEGQRIVHECVARHERMHDIYNCEGPRGGNECLPTMIEGICLGSELYDSQSCGCDCEDDLITVAYESVPFCNSDCTGAPPLTPRFCKAGYCALAGTISQHANCPAAQQRAAAFLQMHCADWP